MSVHLSRVAREEAVPSYILYSPQGSKPLSGLQIEAGAVSRCYDKSTKSQLLQMSPTARISFLHAVPASSTSSSVSPAVRATGTLPAASQRIIVLQLFCDEPARATFSLAVEFTLQDRRGRRRIVFSSNFARSQRCAQHIKVPLHCITPGEWLNLVFDVPQLHATLCGDGGVESRRLLQVTLSCGGICRVRRVIGIPQLPQDAEEWPLSLRLPPEVPSRSWIIRTGEEEFLQSAPPPPVRIAVPPESYCPFETAEGLNGSLEGADEAPLVVEKRGEVNQPIGKEREAEVPRRLSDAADGLQNPQNQYHHHSHASPLQASQLHLQSSRQTQEVSFNSVNAPVRYGTGIGSSRSQMERIEGQPIQHYSLLEGSSLSLARVEAPIQFNTAVGMRSALENREASCIQGPSPSRASPVHPLDNLMERASHSVPHAAAMAVEETHPDYHRALGAMQERVRRIRAIVGSSPPSTTEAPDSPPGRRKDENGGGNVNRNDSGGEIRIGSKNESRGNRPHGSLVTSRNACSKSKEEAMDEEDEEDESKYTPERERDRDVPDETNDNVGADEVDDGCEEEEEEEEEEEGFTVNVCASAFARDRPAVVMPADASLSLPPVAPVRPPTAHQIDRLCFDPALLDDSTTQAPMFPATREEETMTAAENPLRAASSAPMRRGRLTDTGVQTPSPPPHASATSSRQPPQRGGATRTAASESSTARLAEEVESSVSDYRRSVTGPRTGGTFIRLGSPRSALSSRPTSAMASVPATGPIELDGGGPFVFDPLLQCCLDLRSNTYVLLTRPTKAN